MIRSICLHLMKKSFGQYKPLDTSELVSFRSRFLIQEALVAHPATLYSGKNFVSKLQSRGNNKERIFWGKKTNQISMSFITAYFSMSWSEAVLMSMQEVEIS